MKSRSMIVFLTATAALLLSAAPALALFTPHSGKGLNSVAGEATLKDGSGTIQCAGAKASGGEINATGTESNIGTIAWNECSAKNGELKAPVVLTCNNIVFEQPNKEGTKTGKFTLKLNEDCTAKITDKTATCIVTLPAERNKKKEKGMQMKEVEEEGLKEKETSQFTSSAMVATLIKSPLCELLGVKESTEVAVAIPKIKQEGVGLE